MIDSRYARASKNQPLVNEILNRITSKIQVLRLHIHEWTEEDTWAMINDFFSNKVTNTQ